MGSQLHTNDRPSFFTAILTSFAIMSEELALYPTDFCEAYLALHGRNEARRTTPSNHRPFQSIRFCSAIGGEVKTNL
jgi:hypothetical protein